MLYDGIFSKDPYIQIGKDTFVTFCPKEGMKTFVVIHMTPDKVKVYLTPRNRIEFKVSKRLK